MSVHQDMGFLFRLGLAAAVLAGTSGPASGQTGSAAPIDLKTAVSEALVHGPSMRPAVDAIALADLRRQVAAGQFSLSIAPVIGATVGRDGQPQRRAGIDASQRFRFGTDVSVSANLQQDGRQAFEQSAAYSATVSQSLLQAFGPGRTAEVTQAERDVAAATRQHELARQQVILDVAQTFFAVVAQQRLVTAAEQALTRAQTLRASSEARTEVGLATRLDVLRADLLASQAEAQVESQRELLADQLDQLKVMTGRPLSAELTVAWDRTQTVARPLPGDVEVLVPVALEARLDLKDVRERVRDADRAASVARWNVMPDIGVTASYAERRYAGLPAEAFGRNVFGGWQFGLVTTYRHDRSARAGVAAADIALQAARRTVEDMQQRVEADVRRAYRGRVRAEGTVEIQTRAVDLAQQQLRLAQLRYERGLADNFDVIDAEAAVFQAETALIAAEGARELAALALDRALGHLTSDALPGGSR